MDLKLVTYGCNKIGEHLPCRVLRVWTTNVKVDRLRLFIQQHYEERRNAKRLRVHCAHAICFDEDSDVATCSPNCRYVNHVNYLHPLLCAYKIRRYLTHLQVL
jgi:hypothetical protein